jgi:uncharacterized ferredoxin-like protein
MIEEADQILKSYGRVAERNRGWDDIFQGLLSEREALGNRIKQLEDEQKKRDNKIDEFMKVMNKKQMK